MPLAEFQKQAPVGHFIDTSEASDLLATQDERRYTRCGGMSIHYVSCPARGPSVLVQGCNGDFALVSLAS